MHYIFSIFLTLFLIGCGDDNSYDGKTGLIGGVSVVDSSLEDLYADVYQSDANLSATRLENLIEDLAILQNEQNEQTLQSAQESFYAFVRAQKRIEAAFIADEFDSTFLDTLGYMEYFHVGKNSDLISELDRVFSSSTSIQNALFKNSNKSITSLEYTLFGEDENTSTLLEKFDTRRAEAALFMAQNIQNHTLSIQNFYSNDKSFTLDIDVTTAALINQLIDSAYKLKEWRIGEAAGFVLKYEGSVDRTLLEYYKSRFSLEAIKEILLTHQRIMQEGLSAIATNANAAAEAEAVEQTLQTALSLCESYSEDLQDALTQAKTKELYNTINLLQQNYTALISSLNFTQKIIEADGD